jgi:hypothetical protein
VIAPRHLAEFVISAGAAGTPGPASRPAPAYWAETRTSGSG